MVCEGDLGMRPGNEAMFLYHALCTGPRVGGRKTRKTVSQLRDVYWLMKDEIFGENQDGLLGFLAKGNTKELEKTLKGWLGEDVRLHHETYPK